MTAPAENKPTPPARLEQKKYVVAFLDFLGASEKMRSPEASDKFLHKLHMIYSDVITVMAERELLGDGGVKIRIFSDNIVIAKETSRRYDQNAIYKVFSCCCFFQAYALLHGLLVRGGISIGNFYMDHIFLFGEGLVKAHDKEGKHAIYPRIVVDKAVLAGVAIRAVKDYWKTYDDMLEQDYDGELFLNFLIPLLHPKDKKSSVEYLAAAQKSILALFAKDKSNNDVRPKLLWLFNKYNELCKKHDFPKHTILPNGDGEPDIDRFKHFSAEKIEQAEKQILRAIAFDDENTESYQV